MYKLIERNHGKIRTQKYFQDFADLRLHLQENDYFEWIHDNKPDRQRPDFSQVDDVKALCRVFDDYNYNHWRLEVSYDKAFKYDAVRAQLEDVAKQDYITVYDDVEALLDDLHMSRKTLLETCEKSDVVIRDGRPVVLYDNPNSTLFNVAFVSNDMTAEDIINNLT